MKFTCERRTKARIKSCWHKKRRVRVNLSEKTTSVIKQINVYITSPKSTVYNSVQSKQRVMNDKNRSLVTSREECFSEVGHKACDQSLRWRFLTKRRLRKRGASRKRCPNVTNHTGLLPRPFPPQSVLGPSLSLSTKLLPEQSSQSLALPIGVRSHALVGTTTLSSTAEARRPKSESNFPPKSQPNRSRW